MLFNETGQTPQYCCLVITLCLSGFVPLCHRTYMPQYHINIEYPNEARVIKTTQTGPL